MKRSFIIVLFLSWMSGRSQSIEAERLFRQHHYSQALPVLLRELRADSANGRINYEIGICYLQSRSMKQKAVSHLERAVQQSPSIFTRRESGPKEAPDKALMALAEAYEQVTEFEKAVTTYRKYQELIRYNRNASSEVAAIDQRIRSVKLAANVKADHLAMMPAQLRRSLSMSDSAHLQYKFSQEGGNHVHYVNLKPVPEYMRDTRYYAQQLNTPPDTVKPRKKDRKKDNQPDTLVNVTTVGVSPDGQEILTYRDENGEAQLYLSRLKRNRWSAPERMVKPVNPNEWEFAESLNPDQSVMYFVSDRKGGYGGKDIYMCRRQKDGTWGRAVNLGPTVNSKFDEEAPYAHTDGKTLYFSSNRIRPEKCYDQFMTIAIDSTQWSKPVQTGYPEDEKKEGEFYQVSADSKPKVAMKPMNRKDLRRILEDSINDVKASKNNNFIFTFSNDVNKAKTFIYSGEIGRQSGLEQADQLTDVSVELYDTTGKLLIQSHPDVRGRFSICIPGGSAMMVRVAAPGFLPAYQWVSTNHDTVQMTHPSFTLQPVDKKKVAQVPVRFVGNTAVLTTESKAELSRLSRDLGSYRGMKIKFNYVTPEKSGIAGDIASQRWNEITTFMKEQGMEQCTIKGGCENSDKAWRPEGYLEMNIQKMPKKGKS